MSSGTSSELLYSKSSRSKSDSSSSNSSSSRINSKSSSAQQEQQRKGKTASKTLQISSFKETRGSPFSLSLPPFFPLVVMRFNGRNHDPTLINAELLPTHQLDQSRYRKRRLSFSGWSLSSSPREARISLTEIICVLALFVILARYACRPPSLSPRISFGGDSRQQRDSSPQRPRQHSSEVAETFVGSVKASDSSPSSLSTSLTRPASRSQDVVTKSHNGPRIAAAMTTSKRPELFRRAYLSFRLRCLDCDAKISRWFAVDDGSSPEQFQEMQAVSPEITWLSKTGKNQTGHVSSLNRILEEVVDQYDYLVFLEDDFFFVKDEDYVAKALNIFAKNESIGQIVFNRRYSLTNTEVEDKNQVGGIEVRDPATGNVTYMLHEYIGPAGSPEWKAYFAKHPGVGSVHWPHFSLNSGVWKLKALKDVGPFEKRDGFEFLYGLRWMKKGYVTAFFPGKYSIHLGKALPNSAISAEVLDSMYAGQGLKHSVAKTASAYDLNGVIR